MLSTGAWLIDNTRLAIFAIAVATIVGWPFSAALGLPLALTLVMGTRKNIWKFFCYSCLSALLTVVPSAIVDYYFYWRLVIASLNIILYNVFGTGGPDLYGVEPWTFYFVNGFLNFNIVFLFGITSAVIWVILAIISGISGKTTYSKSQLQKLAV
jgi:alpha-1,2-mannosyltransferase